MAEPAHTKGRLTKEHFAAAYVAMGCKCAVKAALSINLSPSHGRKLLADKYVKELIADAKAATIENLDAARLRLMTENEYLATSDVFEIFVSHDPEEVIYAAQSLPIHARKAVKAVTAKTESKPDGSTKTEIKLEMHDKNAAHNLRAKFLGLLDKAQGGAAGLGDFVKAAMLAPDDPLE